MRFALTIISIFLFTTLSAQGVDSLFVPVPEVSVTAQMKQRGLVEHTVAKTEIFMKAAERESIDDMRSVSAYAPNFYVPDYGSRMTSSIYMRGMGARID